jgi:lipoate-protein ligase A
MAESPPAEPWRLLRTLSAEPGACMALDEALLVGLADARPCLRVYTFARPTLSLGYFQGWAQVPAAARARDCVRRMTGGGAILHERELTFAIAAPLEHALYRGPVAQSYARVHALIAQALASLGVAVEPAGARPLASDRAGTGMCFHESSPPDLALAGRKLVGSAQRRSGGRVLHHGSIKIGATAEEPGAGALELVLPEIGIEALAARLELHFARALGLRFEPESPNAAELAHVAERAAHFASPAFLHRR